MSIYQEWTESVAAINAGVTYTVPIPESFLKWGAANELIVSVSENASEELEILIDNNSWALLGAGGIIVIEKKDKKFFTSLKIKNTDATTNTANDEVKVLVRRVV